MEEGECDSSFSEEEEEEEGETGGKLKIAAVEENGENKEEGGIILSAIQQELQKDVSWSSSDDSQLETRNRHMTGEEEGEGEETEDKVPIERLEALGHCDVIWSMLTNRHLRDLLLELDASPAPQQALRRAMNIPVFVEFADQCLRVCGLRDDDDKL